MSDRERLLLAAIDGDEAAFERLDAEGRAEFAEDLGLHHRLQALLGKNPPDLSTAVARELRYENDGARFAADVVGRLRPSRRLSLALPLAAAAGFLLLIAALLVPGAERPAAPRGRALLVVGQPISPGDLAARRRLEKLGFEVTALSAAALTREAAETRDLLVVSSSSPAEDVRAAELLRELPRPIIAWEPRLFHPLGLTRGSVYHQDWGGDVGSGRLRILDSSHPLAAGLHGAVRVTGGEGRVSWGRVPADALRIAEREGEEGRTSIFAYEAGRLAPARRVGLFLFESSVPDLTSDGWRLFDAAVAWATSSP